MEESASTLLEKHKFMLCKVPDPIYKMIKKFYDNPSNNQKVGQIILKPNGDVEIEFDEDQIDTTKNNEITEDVSKDYKVKPFKASSKNCFVFSTNKELNQAKCSKKIEFSASLHPKGLYKSGKKEEDLIRPRIMKEDVQAFKEMQTIKFDLNHKYHQPSKKDTKFN
ncbi:unnamed protein product [Moneuplotes crassus]|uniref:TFIIF beta subunit N-terminal domain-containing protein n=1 Tax=Euplotes crassus TaxID=5936 RepID=A0AAD2D516_EUPCR|nr:unnamed protein product [Moneuplotes crassus]